MHPDLLPGDVDIHEQLRWPVGAFGVPVWTAWWSVCCLEIGELRESEVKR